jgi:hypothetical protein
MCSQFVTPRPLVPRPEEETAIAEFVGPPTDGNTLLAMIEVTQAIKNATMGDFNGEISSSLAPRQSLSRVNKTEDVSTSFFSFCSKNDARIDDVESLCNQARPSRTNTCTQIQMRKILGSTKRDIKRVTAKPHQ